MKTNRQQFKPTRLPACLPRHPVNSRRKQEVIGMRDFKEEHKPL